MSKQKRKLSIKRLAIVLAPVVLVIALFFFLFPSVTFVKGERVLEKGVAYRAEDFIEKLRKTVNASAFGGNFLPVKIEAAELKNQAGMIGAALL